MRSLTTSPNATTTGAPPGRKRRSAYNTNVSGKYRSVVDYEEDELRLAMVTAQGGGNGDGLLLSDEMNEMILAIQDGQPVQKVSIKT
jgi:hypothetical protein